MSSKQKKTAVAVRYNFRMSKSDKISLAFWKARGVPHGAIVKLVRDSEEAYASFRKKPTNFMTTLRSMGIKLDRKYGGDGD